MNYDEKYIHFVVLFNVDEDYFECHEVMEELWLEEGRNLFYQGLLQVAVGLHHWRNDNYSGAVKLFTAALEKLEGYPDDHMGLNIEQVRHHSRHALEPLEKYVSGLSDRTKAGAAPRFEAFKIEVTDPLLASAAGELAKIPLEQRLHGDNAHD
ncbi:DUF309 domain-containing protein [Paenibacillus abyssi]|uniref:DUF309 domain-containing protein n=1 Tax=Paenibacillus abyssi TaxID=1340531 RepID=A0A917FZJ4_9BACL|nr:DUF309 domain-containing protein [Paenibacillus abyssi]GGG15293.1 hypothetical protein GCM10010916_35280 [Paenibacillus abyssi]